MTADQYDSDQMEQPDHRVACWHCVLKQITIAYQPSAKYPDTFVGYVHNAKVCSVQRITGRTWRGKVFLPFANGYQQAERVDRSAAQEWCLETVKLWFGQLDHD